MVKQVQLTKKGFEALKSEFKVLLETKRPKLIERIANARSQGDLSENSDYQNAKEELEFLEGRIDELKGVIKNSKIVADMSKSGTDVRVGTRVTVRVNGSKSTFEIVGDWEADPINKKISPTSPLGSALIGRKTGDKLEVDAPAGKIQYEIIAIE